MGEAIFLNRKNGGGTNPGLPPSFSTDAQYTYTDEGNGNWNIRFTSSGTFRFDAVNSACNGIDVFCVGGGGAGGASRAKSEGLYVSGREGGGGGGGGYTKSQSITKVYRNVPYVVVVGEGGIAGTPNGTDGGATSFSLAQEIAQNHAEATAFSVEAAGGHGGLGNATGGDGGSGGANGAHITWRDHDAGYSDGAGGTGAVGLSGKGQGYSTRAFYEIDQDLTAELFSGGGGGGAGFYNVNKDNPTADYRRETSGGAVGGGSGGGFHGDADSGTPNTGGGGGGGSGLSSPNIPGAAGGSGIVIIRNKRG